MKWLTVGLLHFIGQVGLPVVVVYESLLVGFERKELHINSHVWENKLSGKNISI